MTDMPFTEEMMEWLLERMLEDMEPLDIDDRYIKYAVMKVEDREIRMSIKQFRKMLTQVEECRYGICVDFDRVTDDIELIYEEIMEKIAPLVKTKPKFTIPLIGFPPTPSPTDQSGAEPS